MTTAINWYRVPMDPKLLTELNERSNWKGFVQAGGYLSILLLTSSGSYFSYLFMPWYITLMVLFLHGTVTAFTINAVHELVHGTVFRTRWLNSVFVCVFSFLGWHNHRYFWGSHAEHHKFTLHPPDDLEIVLPATQTIPAFIKSCLVSPHNIWPIVKEHLNIARGRFIGEWATHLFLEGDVSKSRSVSQWAKILLIGHALVIIASLATGQWIIPIIITFAPFYGGWLFFLCNNTQHCGLVDNVTDFRLCCRTVYFGPISQFLYWRMNYHTEHHMYAAVPCYNLPRLHEAVRYELPPTLNGLIETWVQIGYIMRRQRDDPTYQHVQQLPGQQSENTKPVRTTEPKSVRTTLTSQSRRWECAICGFIYDESQGLPEEGISPGTAWSDIPDDWRCPDCGVGKADFQMIEITDSPTTDAPEEDTPSTHKPVTIIGSGMAGYNLVREIRKHDPQLPITLLTRDGGEWYTKPMLSNALTRKQSPDDLISATAKQMAERHNITVRTGMNITHIDRQRKILTTDTGEVPYDQLVLALGANPIKLPIAGAAADRVHRVNDLNSYRSYHEQLSKNQTVVVIGAGLIGCEFADDLISCGHTVEVVDMADRPLSQLVPLEIATALQTALSQRGVTWRFGVSVRSIEHDEGGRLRCELSDDQPSITADVVVSAVGLTSNIALAKQAGLEIGRGICVDSQLRTSDPDIFALGDCAEVDGQVLPYVMPLVEASRALAMTLTGKPTTLCYPIMPVTVKTPSCPVIVVSPIASKTDNGNWTIDGNKGDRCARFVDNQGTLHGFALCGQMVSQQSSLLQQMTDPQKSVTSDTPSEATNPSIT